MDVSDGDGTYDCIGPIDTVLAAARGDAVRQPVARRAGCPGGRGAGHRLPQREVRSGRAPGVMSGPPFAEDLVPDVPLPPAPDITIDAGLAAQYLGVSGDQLRLARERCLLGRRSPARDERMANPGLVLALSIGQSTVATGRVIANLQYRDVALLGPCTSARRCGRS